MSRILFAFLDEVVISAVFQQTDDNDTLSSTGEVVVSAYFAQTDEDDILTADGFVVVSAVFSETDEADTLSSTGTVEDPPYNGAFFRQTDEDDGLVCIAYSPAQYDRAAFPKYHPVVKGPVFHKIMALYRQGQLRRDITTGPPVTSEREARIIAYLTERDQELKKKAAVEGTNWSDNPYTLQKV